MLSLYYIFIAYLFICMLVWKVTGGHTVANRKVLVLTFIKDPLHLGVGSWVCSSWKQWACFFCLTGCFWNVNCTPAESCYLNSNERKFILKSSLLSFHSPAVFISSSSSTVFLRKLRMDLFSGSSNLKGVSYDTRVLQVKMWWESDWYLLTN